MSAKLIDGIAAARRVREQVAKEVATLPAPPGLATVLVGDDPSSAVYVRSKRRQCVVAGMLDLHRHLPGDVTEDAVAAVLDDLAADSRVTGILLQLPLPPHLDARALVEHIPVGKDIDGLTERSTGRLALGTPGLRPCTPAGVMMLLDEAGTVLDGVHAVVVGRSELVGKPMAQLLLQRNATVTVCHSRTRDLAAVCRTADVLVAAAGVPGLVGVDAIKPGATVIDVGIHRTPSGLRGDVDTGPVCDIAGAVTPVPGGVGPMTIAMLLANTVRAAVDPL
ncbi:MULTISPECIES: bifunctional 5,10-methylenetetrahydrofolate dehydrogenase/5,10-methenyltetrahydrofolate cyclohydrolase [Mycolicibacterium]|uniref:Bifunctional protein FolD n=1 Tax=Mycolicibacterium senegalense TaxID=1796 RepID=A0A378W5Y9_9MYCO|nr:MULTISPECIES: bifunctional 5,10-methylenetetrahydrofolate dehydrogenase/5,10-methenyltetrahydrofolate cyclohydrolase [Mycolicibacterium]MCV7336067.1 bifunctional 5,10-methylenetetrahydrofolate dehydrogenase/5,10-methenyltetrahydrofolate cyclohydrolase [Mycolicibacterium senegalense]MDR7287927.1 methylenetetrahydrofolate dehydrogenase (NADP+)/methenyltetrahydrofolate cyclohydrolase [Mycolicibacterium senegalense]QZA24930.1 bifunctional 5,10-methylenetetrahydrofolate dehydrogenase/5,10-methenyl